MKIIFYTISLATLIIILITPSFFHNDVTKSFDKIVFISTIINGVLGSLSSIKIKRFNFYTIAFLQLIYCIITISNYEHNNSYWLRLYAIISKENNFFKNNFLSLLETLMYYIVFIIFILQIRNIVLIIFQFSKKWISSTNKD
ncbi:hypothetical protein [Chryseobacterium defluvii]|uniref:Uncharacterized protein n=1 Tax=Chryseobacterium defluvii TaxID=160396 RepID=A0A495SNC5_9FLAO|nr:hypothetical protein [Chryseobacterium defluvii]RKT00940.1 hypothetical protein BCF58_0142 [Chryseobacterium defluvii]